jgi:hypothetical protein
MDQDIVGEKDLIKYFRVAAEQRCLEDPRMKRVAALRLRADPYLFATQSISRSNEEKNND